MTTTWVGSPNFTAGRQGNKPSKIVIHWMAGTLAATDAVFQNTTRQTSAHYGIENNTVHQYVKEVDTAYHAGTWDANLKSIGIEHSAAPDRPASDATYATSIQLCTEICQRWGISPDNIVPHSSIVATQCPGTVDLNRIKAGVKLKLGGQDMAELEQLRQQVKDMQAQIDIMRPDLVDSHNRIDGLLAEITAERKGYEAQIADLKAQLAAGSSGGGDPKLEALGKAIKEYVS